MRLSYTELTTLSAILRSPTRTLVLTRDSSTYIDQRRLLDALNRKDIFLLTIEDIKRGAALRGLEVSAIIYDETVGTMSLTDEERAEVNSRIRLPFGGTKAEIVAIDETPKPNSTLEAFRVKMQELQNLADEVAGIPGAKHE